MAMDQANWHRIVLRAQSIKQASARSIGDKLNNLKRQGQAGARLVFEELTNRSKF